jgi:hypothetical protein
MRHKLAASCARRRAKVKPDTFWAETTMTLKGIAARGKRGLGRNLVVCYTGSGKANEMENTIIQNFSSIFFS